MKALKFIGSIFLLIIECIFYLVGCLFGISFFMDIIDRK